MKSIKGFLPSSQTTFTQLGLNPMAEASQDSVARMSRISSSFSSWYLWAVFMVISVGLSWLTWPQ